MDSSSTPIRKIAPSETLVYLGFLWALFVMALFFSRIPWEWRVLPSLWDLSRFPAVPWGERVFRWAGSVWVLSAGFLSAGILWSLGRRVRKFLGLTGPTLIEFCLDLGFGAALMNAAWLGSGLNRLWILETGLPVFGLLSVILLADLLPLRRRGFSLPSIRRAPEWAVLVGSVYLFFLILHCLLPETFYDSLNYFLGMPAYWLERHGITDYPSHMLSGYFQGGSLYLLNGFILGGTESAKVLNAVLYAALAALAYAWVREEADPSAGAAAGAAVLTLPLLYLNAWAARVDVFLVFCFLLFLYCLQKGLGAAARSGAWNASAGIFAGLAVSVKPTALVGVAAALAAGVIHFGPSVLKKRGWVPAAGFFLMGILPWLLKNACFDGNPFFPYGAAWMGGRPLSEFGAKRLWSENTQFLPMGSGPVSWLTLPWRLTMPGAGDGQFIGPLVLAFGPVGLALAWAEKRMGFLWKTALLSLGLGLCLSHMLRFSLPAFVLILMVLSASLASGARPFRRRIWISAVALSAALCFVGFAAMSVRYYDGIGVWSGSESRQSYLDRKLMDPYGPMARWIDANLPGTARLLIVGDARGVYYGREFLANSAFDEPFLAEAARKEKDAAGILRRIREAGVTHLAVNLPEGLRNAEEYRQYDLTPEQWSRLNRFAAERMKPVYWKDFLAVYEVPFGPLTASKSPHRPVNPFSFFYPGAYDFFRDEGTAGSAAAGRDLDRVLALFPEEPFWWEKKARWEGSAGSPARCYSDYRRADSLGGLSAEGYRQWAATALGNHDRPEAAAAGVLGRKAYPQALKGWKPF